MAHGEDFEQLKNKYPKLGRAGDGFLFIIINAQNSTTREEKMMTERRNANIFPFEFHPLALHDFCI